MRYQGQIHRDSKWNGNFQGQREGGIGSFVYWYRVSVLQTERRSGDGLHRNVNVLYCTVFGHNLNSSLNFIKGGPN